MSTQTTKINEKLTLGYETFGNHSTVLVKSPVFHHNNTALIKNKYPKNTKQYNTKKNRIIAQIFSPKIQ